MEIQVHGLAPGLRPWLRLYRRCAAKQRRVYSLTWLNSDGDSIPTRGAASWIVGRTDRDTLLHMNERPPERVVIRGVLPELECGRFAVKRVVGESVNVEADIFADGHDAIVPAVRYRHEDDEPWSELPMTPLGNDHWQAKFTVGKLGQYIYTITAWIDSFQTWYTDFLKRVAAEQGVTVDLQIRAGPFQDSAESAKSGHS